MGASPKEVALFGLLGMVVFFLIEVILNQLNQSYSFVFVFFQYMFGFIMMSGVMYSLGEYIGLNLKGGEELC